MGANPEPTDIQIPAAVAALLNPIPGDLPAGQDASSKEAYFKLEMEIGKVSPDYRLCADLASEILSGKSKDLRVAVWLCFTWFRNDKIPGFVNGLLLIQELLKRYGNGLFPASPVHRGKSLQFLNSGRVVKLFEAEKVAGDTAPAFLGLSGAFEKMLAESRKQLAELAPELNNLAQTITSRVTDAKQILEDLRAAPKADSARPTEKPPGEKPRAEPLPQVKEPLPEKSKEGERPKEKPAPEPPGGLKDLAAGSEKDAIVAVKRALKYFLEQEKDEAKKYQPMVFGISRALVWGRVLMPSHEDFVTPFNAPDAAIQGKIKEWFANKEWDKLIPAVELNFLDEDSGFKNWLTAQRYVCGALEQKGGGAAKTAEEIRFHLAWLLRRFPDFVRLRFNDKTPLADDETSRWIDESVRTAMGKGGQDAEVLPPILGEDYEPINREYRSACADLPADFEKNLKAMQLGMAGEIRRKGRFLRTLNLANYCLAAKQYELASIHVSGLLEKIESYQLTAWEPALCLATWESAYLVTKKLMAGEKNKERLASLEQQQKDLFARIGNLDGALALRLARLK
jgi:type VI secretion system protein VasJ